MSTVPTCKRCNKRKSVKLRRQINGGGSIVYMWYCTDCDHVADNKKPFIKKDLVQSWIDSGRIPSFEAIPIANDYSVNRTCEVCGDNGAELHHWFPQAIARALDISDHSSWPTSYLCKPCHDLWHTAVTPYLKGVHWRDSYEQLTNISD